MRENKIKGYDANDIYENTIDLAYDPESGPSSPEINMREQPSSGSELSEDEAEEDLNVADGVA